MTSAQLPITLSAFGLTGEHLHTSANTANDKSLYVSVHGFWQDDQKEFFDIRVFSSFVPSHLASTLQKNIERNEKEKKRLYSQRVIEMEHESFSSLVFTPYGGASRETELVFKTLCAKVPSKRNLEYSRNKLDQIQGFFYPLEFSHSLYPWVERLEAIS